MTLLGNFLLKQSRNVLLLFLTFLWQISTLCVYVLCIWYILSSRRFFFFWNFYPSEMMSTCVRNVKKHWEPPSFRDTAQGKLPRFWKIGVGN